MKRIILISCFVLLSAGMVYAALIPVSVANPNFLTDLSNWTTSSDLACGTEPFWDAGGHSDAGQVVFNCDGGDAFAVQSVPIVSAGTYTVSVWAECADRSGVVYLYLPPPIDISYYSSCPITSYSECSASGYVETGLSNLTVGIGFSSDLSNGAGTCYFDNATLAYEPIPPTPTPSTSVSIPLSSGNRFTLNYTWSFGEMAVAALLAIVVVMFCARWVYDVVIQLWSMRGDNDSI